MGIIDFFINLLKDPRGFIAGWIIALGPVWVYTPLFLIVFVETGLGLFPEEVNSSTRVLFVNLGAEEEAAVLPLLRQLRGREIAAEIYPEAGKMKKQMEYANRRGIPYVVIVGSQELEAGAATVKDMRTGEQRQVSLDKLATEICNS